MQLHRSLRSGRGVSGSSAGTGAGAACGFVELGIQGCLQARPISQGRLDLLHSGVLGAGVQTNSTRHLWSGGKQEP